MAVKKPDPALHIAAYDPSRARCHTGRLSDAPINLSETARAKLRAYWNKPQHRNTAPVRLPIIF